MSKETMDYLDPLEEAVVRVLEKSKRHPMSFPGLKKDVARKIESQRDARILQVVEDLIARGDVLEIRGGAQQEYYWRENLAYLKSRLCEIVRTHHTKHPYEQGMKTGDIKKGFSKTQTQKKARNIDPRLYELAFSACMEEGLVIEVVGGVRLHDFVPKGPEDEEIAGFEDEVMRLVIGRGHQRLDIDKVSALLGRERRLTKAVLARLVSTGRLVLIGEGRYLEPKEIDRAKRILHRKLGGGNRAHVSDLIEVLGLSRNATVSLMEYFDRIGFTRRDGDLRSLVVK